MKIRKFTIEIPIVNFMYFHRFARFSSFFSKRRKHLTSDMFFSAMNQRIYKFFFANPIIFRRSSALFLQNSTKKYGDNQTRNPDIFS